MTDQADQDIKTWVRHWKAAGAAMVEVKKQELRAVNNDEKKLRILDEMLQYACDHAEVRLSSGLVEQQRIFMKLRQRSGRRR